MASSNTSKTAHVMNLLSKNRSSAASEPAAEPQAEAAAPAAPQAAPEEPPRSAPVAPIITSLNADAAVSSQIKDALEAELEAPAPAAAQAPAQQPAPAPVQEAAPAPETPPVQAPPMEEELSFLSRDEVPAEEHGYINVMQILVEEKADECMKMFGICCCDKCRLDVRALALNHLPPKYVVLSENERVPRLTVYENRFASDITAQLIQACKQVMLTPHHSREDS